MKAPILLEKIQKILEGGYSILRIIEGNKVRIALLKNKKTMDVKVLPSNEADKQIKEWKNHYKISDQSVSSY